MTEQNITARMAELKQQEAALMAEAHDRRAALLDELAGLCAALGPLVRSEIPDGILKRRERTVKPKAAAKVRKVKAAEAA